MIHDMRNTSKWLINAARLSYWPAEVTHQKVGGLRRLGQRPIPLGTLCFLCFLLLTSASFRLRERENHLAVAGTVTIKSMPATLEARSLSLGRGLGLQNSSFRIFVLLDSLLIQRGSGVMDFPHLTAPCYLPARVGLRYQAEAVGWLSALAFR